MDDKEKMVGKYARCVSNTYCCDELTKGKWYEILVEDGSYFVIKNNDGDEYRYSKCRFDIVPQKSSIANKEIEMTPCSMLGYKVGDKFKLNQEAIESGDCAWLLRGHAKHIDEIFTLLEDDMTYAPYFQFYFANAYLGLDKVEKVTEQRKYPTAALSVEIDSSCLDTVETKLKRIKELLIEIEEIKASVFN